MGQVQREARQRAARSGGAGGAPEAEGTTSISIRVARQLEASLKRLAGRHATVAETARELLRAGVAQAGPVRTALYRAEQPAPHLARAIDRLLAGQALPAEDLVLALVLAAGCFGSRGGVPLPAAWDGDFGRAARVMAQELADQAALDQLTEQAQVAAAAGTPPAAGLAEGRALAVCARLVTAAQETALAVSALRPCQERLLRLACYAAQRELAGRPDLAPLHEGLLAERLLGCASDASNEAVGALRLQIKGGRFVGELMLPSRALTRFRLTYRELLAVMAAGNQRGPGGEVRVETGSAVHLFLPQDYGKLRLVVETALAAPGFAKARRALDLTYGYVPGLAPDA